LSKGISFPQLQGDIEMMKRSLTVAGLTLLSALVASAWPQDQEFPKWETFLGYDFVRFNPNSDFIPSFNANGGSGQFAYNFNRWIGLAFDAGAVNKGVLNQYPWDTTVANFTAGPRFSWRKWSRFRLYGQVLFGGFYATTSAPIAILTADNAVIPPGFNVVPGGPTTARVNASTTGFAMLAGGGLDIKLARHIAIRPFEASYYLTRFPTFFTNGTRSNINNFRYSGGINFTWGYPK
jgi:hypothetical protein